MKITICGYDFQIISEFSLKYENFRVKSTDEKSKQYLINLNKASMYLQGFYVFNSEHLDKNGKIKFEDFSLDPSSHKHIGLMTIKVLYGTLEDATKVKELWMTNIAFDDENANVIADFNYISVEKDGKTTKL